MKFSYTSKDQFSKTEVEELLNQHEGFLKKSHIAKEEFDKVQTELQSHKAKIFENQINDHLKSYDAKQQQAIKKISAFKGSETSDEIAKIIKTTIEEFPFITSAKTDSLAINKPITKPNEEKKPSKYIR